MKKTIVLIVIFFLSVCCGSSKKSLTVTFIPSTENVFLHYNESWKTISEINIPFNFSIENHTSQKEQLVRYSYNYGNNMEGHPTRLFIKKNKGYIKLKNSEDIFIEGHKTNSYKTRTKHFIDTTRFGRTFFEPYIKEMQRSNQDSLNVGSILEFKVKHKEFFTNLLKNDSISLLFLDENSETNFRKVVKQVEY
ncbi:hypothetical protein [Maribacter luteus]|uniref:hypothetical protein n=1 Tax=Maribacter luteus TaxID=2594478 RepID=UPI002492B2C4|nr:hypothetical protein [Maribacter luteus]